MPKRRAPRSESRPGRLYRVFPWLEDAPRGAAGHPLHVPTVQGAGRIDNPESYAVLYASDSAVGAVAEAFGNHATWTEELFLVPSLPGARRALATYAADRVTILDLDDASALLERGLKPSEVVTRDRARTRRWALEVFRERRWDGIRWWSFHDPDRGSCGLWRTVGLTVLEVAALTLDAPPVIEAATLLHRVLETG